MGAAKSNEVKQLIRYRRQIQEQDVILSRSELQISELERKVRDVLQAKNDLQKEVDDRIRRVTDLGINLSRDVEKFRIKVRQANSAHNMERVGYRRDADRCEVEISQELTRIASERQKYLERIEKAKALLASDQEECLILNERIDISSNLEMPLSEFFGGSIERLLKFDKMRSAVNIDAFCKEDRAVLELDVLRSNMQRHQLIAEIELWKEKLLEIENSNQCLS